MARQSLREVSQFVDYSLTMYVSKSMTFPTPHIGHSRHGLFFTTLDCQSNDNPSEKDHDLPGIFRIAVSIYPTTTPFRSSENRK
jgi:hypothetical protein